MSTPDQKAAIKLRPRYYEGFRVYINRSLPPNTYRVSGPRSIECSADFVAQLSALLLPEKVAE